MPKASNLSSSFYISPNNHSVSSALLGLSPKLSPPFLLIPSHFILILVLLKPAPSFRNKFNQAIMSCHPWDENTSCLTKALRQISKPWTWLTRFSMIWSLLYLPLHPLNLHRSPTGISPCPQILHSPSQQQFPVSGSIINLPPPK